MSKESLINAYRPKTFTEIIGQNNIVSSYRKALKNHISHGFLFTGPAGCGKTSLCRLGAQELGAKGKQSIIEIDGASFSGVDNMRDVTTTLQYRPLGVPVKVIIVDEAHRLSGSAWDSMLKITEEPPEWCYWFISTTAVEKVPKTIRTRCASYTLKPVDRATLIDYLKDICDAEGFKTSDQIIQLCVKEAGGSPRQALSHLAVCYAAKSREEAAGLIANEEEGEDANGFVLAKALLAGWKWEKIIPIVEKISETDSAEGARNVVRNYLAKVLLGTKDPQKAYSLLQMLDNFAEPFPQSEGMSPLILAVGRSLFLGES